MAETGSETESATLFLTALYPEDLGGRVADPNEYFWAAA